MMSPSRPCSAMRRSTPLFRSKLECYPCDLQRSVDSSVISTLGSGGDLSGTDVFLDIYTGSSRQTIDIVRGIVVRAYVFGHVCVGGGIAGKDNELDKHAKIKDYLQM